MQSLLHISCPTANVLHYVLRSQEHLKAALHGPVRNLQNYFRHQRFAIFWWTVNYYFRGGMSKCSTSLIAFHLQCYFLDYVRLPLLSQSEEVVEAFSFSSWVWTTYLSKLQAAGECWRERGLGWWWGWGGGGQRELECTCGESIVLISLMPVLPM